MNNKVALITGANKGLGLEIGRQLGRQGITVLLGARSLSKAEAAAAQLKDEQIEAIGLELDVTNSNHIEEVTNWIRGNYGKLDILINNAGVHLDNSESGIDAMRKTFETNVFGVYALTTSLLPLLKASPSGRIVNQSSLLGSMSTVLSNELAGSLARPFYSSSKAALNMLTAQLSTRLKGTTVKVNAVHPGLVKTDMGGASAPMEIEEGAESAVLLATLSDDGPTGGFFHKETELPW